jgi:hypothetical protein
MTKAMLHRESKLLIMFLLITTVVSCGRYKEYNVKEINKIKNNAIGMSKSLLGEDEYNMIYNNMIDTINSWIENKLRNYAYWTSVINYQVDSVLCVNKERNKIVTSVLLPYVGRGGVSDEITHFYGVKVKGTWYFLWGPTMVLPREYYQKDIHTPLSFEKLKQIATSNIYRRYLVRNKKGEWEINDRFFDGVIPQDGTKEIYGIRSDEEYVKFMIELNWSSDINMTINKYKQRGENDF